MDDSTLVQRAADGDRDAFAVIYDQHAPGLQAFLWWILQNGHRAADVLFDTFNIAGSRLHQLRDPSRLRAWLFAIAAREALDADRHRDPDEGEAQDGADGEFIEVVRAASRELTVRERALLDLRFRQGLRDQELGDAIGVKAESAESLVRRLADRTEHVLGPTLAIHFSRHNCRDLMAIVGTAAGPLDARTRRMAEQHVDNCSTCDGWRHRVGIGTVLGVAPTPPPPADLRRRALDEVQLSGYDGRPWSRRRKGFPPPLVSEHERQAVRWVAAAAVLVVLVTGAFLLTRSDRGSQQVASVGRTSTSTRPARASTTVTTVAATSTSAIPGPGTAGIGSDDAPTGGTTGGSAARGAGGPSISESLSGGSSPDPTEPPDTTPPDSSPPTEPSPTTPPDDDGPALSGLRISPSTLRAGSNCSNSEPTQATVTVHASDPSGIAEVVAIAAGPQTQRVTMSAAGGGAYTATVGPFSSALPVGQEFPGAVVVQATDRLGNQSATSGSLTLRCEPAG